MSLLATPIRVLLVDDHQMVRQALARILEDSGRIRVVAQASRGTEALQAATAFSPDVVVLDYSLPQEAAPEVIQKLIERHRRGIRILVLTVHENVHYAVRIFEAGAHGYLIKSAAVEELVQAIDTISRGGIYISPKVSQQVMAHLCRPRRERTGLESLSQREFDLLRLLGAGKTLQEAARAMGVSTSTASTYRARVMQKLKFASTGELIRFALEHGVVG